MSSSQVQLRAFVTVLGIVNNNELNSYLDYCSHLREYRIWGRKSISFCRRKNYVQMYTWKGVSPVLCLMI